MPTITYITADGETFPVEAEIGSTVMENAINHSVPGILAECGGVCSCATCHVYVEPEWREAVGPPGLIEKDMLEFVTDVRENSRLSCQIAVTEELDGLVVRISASQGQ
jgi:2Fe-2S ferredoxin